MKSKSCKHHHGRAFIKLLSLLLSLSTVLGVVGLLPVYATDTAASLPETQTNENLTELIRENKDPALLARELEELAVENTALREEYVKHIKLADGTYEAISYAVPVHRLNADGEWTEIDNALAESGGVISTGDSRVKFEKKTNGSEKLFTLHGNNVKVTVGLKDAAKKIEGTVTNYGSKLPEDATQLQKIKDIAGLKASIKYENILEDTDIEYILDSNDIKENIIVKEKKDSYAYTFTLELNGLEARLESGSILLVNTDTNETEYVIPAPFMYDASGEISYAASYELAKTGNKKYEYTLTADAEWINAENREFPVVIDPLLREYGQTKDTYVDSARPNVNFGGVTDLVLSATTEVYFQFLMPNLPTSTTIELAYLSIPYYFNNEDCGEISIALYGITSNWEEKGLTYSNKPGTAATILTQTTATLCAEGALYDCPDTVQLSFKQYLEHPSVTTDFLSFKLIRTGGDEPTVYFKAKEYGEEIASISIRYTGNYFSEGTYVIKSSDTQIYLESRYPEDGDELIQDASHTSAPLSANYLEHLFKISYRPQDDDYVIRSMLDSSLLIVPLRDDSDEYSAILEYSSLSDSQLSADYTWNIDSAGSGQYHIYHDFGEVTMYMQSINPAISTHVAFAEDMDEDGTKWSFTQYAGTPIEEIEFTNFASNLYVGDQFNYDAFMRSSRIGQNHAVTYYLTNLNSSVEGSTKASIDATSGLLTALQPGVVSIKATYPGCPYIFNGNLTISLLPVSGYEIPYLPLSWNNDTFVKVNSNCYNYALNKKCTEELEGSLYQYMQPGISIDDNPFGYTITTDTTYNVPKQYYYIESTQEIVNMIEADSEELSFTFTPIDKNTVCPIGTYKVALVIDNYDSPYVDNILDYAEDADNNLLYIIEIPDQDYHWYRQNPDGTWSHKPGRTEVTNLDASDEIIYDPSTCDRDYTDQNGIDYSVFVGFFAVTPLS